jgi:hypothetical protein
MSTMYIEDMFAMYLEDMSIVHGILEDMSTVCGTRRTCPLSTVYLRTCLRYAVPGGHVHGIPGEMSIVHLEDMSPIYIEDMFAVYLDDMSTV